MAENSNIRTLWGASRASPSRFLLNFVSRFFARLQILDPVDVTAATSEFILATPYSIPLNLAHLLAGSILIGHSLIIRSSPTGNDFPEGIGSRVQLLQ